MLVSASRIHEDLALALDALESDIDTSLRTTGHCPHEEVIDFLLQVDPRWVGEYEDAVEAGTHSTPSTLEADGFHGVAFPVLRNGAIRWRLVVTASAMPEPAAPELETTVEDYRETPRRRPILSRKKRRSKRV